MIGALAGHGKTFILLSIAKALLTGKGTKLWNIFDVEESAVRVLYLIPESTLAPFKHRLKLFGLYNHLQPEDRWTALGAHSRQRAGAMLERPENTRRCERRPRDAGHCDSLCGRGQRKLRK